MHHNKPEHLSLRRAREAVARHEQKKHATDYSKLINLDDVTIDRDLLNQHLYIGWDPRAEKFTAKTVNQLTDQVSKLSVATEAYSFTAKSDLSIVDAASDAPGNLVVASLPPTRTALVGRQYSFKRIDTNAGTITVTVKGTGNDALDGNLAGFDLAVQFQTITVVCIGVTRWAIMSEYSP